MTEFLREPFLVPEVKPAEEMFETFRERNLSVAMTVDEFGGITGLITMPDLLEHIFGHIRTLSDAARMQGIEQLEEGRYLVEGDITIGEFNHEMKTKLNGDKAHTVAGLVLNSYGELPPKDSVVEMDGIRFIVSEIDQYRITKLLFELLEPSDDAEVVETEAAESAIAEPAEQVAQVGDQPSAGSGIAQSKGE